MRVTKRMVSLILALAMCMSLLCTTAIAADKDVVEPRGMIGNCPKCGQQGASYNGTDYNQIIFVDAPWCPIKPAHGHTFIGDISHWDCRNCGTFNITSTLQNEDCPYI